MFGDINWFLDRFLGLADAGFALIYADIVFVLNALVVVSLTLAGAMWALKGEAPVAPFFRKLLFIGLFAYLVRNWNAIAGAINQTGAMLGLKAGGGSLTLEQLHNPAALAGQGKVLFGRIMDLIDGLNVFTDFLTIMTLLFAGVMVLIAFFVLALQVFVALITFKLGSLAAFVAVPWGVSPAPPGRRSARSAGWRVRPSDSFFWPSSPASPSPMSQRSQEMTLENGGALDMTCSARPSFPWLGLRRRSPAVMQGNPSLSAAQPVQGAVGAVGMALGTATTIKISEFQQSWNAAVAVAAAGHVPRHRLRARRITPP